ncbi:prepilin peptidase [Patescibacteria group bacterium]|nr:prepilin peptidase [Patescibacteria group bacterium]
MNTLIIVIATVFGLLVGSFLNVIALRFHIGKGIRGRSQCFSCNHVLGWKDLIPLFSFVLQKGRCRYCLSHISVDNLYAELCTGVFFGLIAGRAALFGEIPLTLGYFISTLFLFILFSILIVIFLYDVRHKIIPDVLSLVFGVMSFVSIFLFDVANHIFTYTGVHMPSWFHIFSGILIPLPFVVLWFISRGRWIGLGDPKLMVGIGFLLGFERGVSAVFLSFWLGALFALGLMLMNALFHKTLLRKGKKSIMKAELPFAPFLIIATLVVLIGDANVLLL